MSIETLASTILMAPEPYRGKPRYWYAYRWVSRGATGINRFLATDIGAARAHVESPRTVPERYALVDYAEWEAQERAACYPQDGSVTLPKL